MRHLMYSLRHGVSRLPRVAFHQKRTGIPGGPSAQSLVFGLQHVLDDFLGYFFGADVIGSVGHSLF